MANLSFNFDGEKYISDVFAGGKVLQLSFPKERTQVLYVESRLGATLPWKTVDSRIVERTLILNVPAGGDGQEFRMSCFLQPSAAEIIPQSQSGGGGSQPAPDTVGTGEIINGSIEMEDLSEGVKDNMAERVSQEDLDDFQV